MARVKGGTVTKNRRKKVLKEAKGYFGSKSTLYKTAQEQTFHSGAYAYRDRKANKRNFRKLWITRINAACRENDISYSRFINGLTKANVEINRKMLSEIAINDPKYFTELVNISKKALNDKTIAPKTEVVKEVPVKAEPKKEVKDEPKKEVKDEPKKEVKDEPKKEVKDEPKKEVKVDLSALTVTELKQLAKDNKLTGYSTLKKSELIDALKKVL